MRHKPHMAVIVLCKPLDLCEQPADMLCLTGAAWSSGVQLIVRVNDKALNPISAME